MSIKISGLLKENNSSNSLSGLYVEAYNEAHTVWLGGAKSDVNGRFTFYLREDTEVSEFPILLIVYRNNLPYHTQKLAAFAAQYEIILSSLNERVPHPTHEWLDSDKDFFVIYGTLKDAAGRPMPAERILFSASGFRTKNPITYAETDHKGHYSAKIARASLNAEETTGERSLVAEAIKLVEGVDTVFATSGDLFDIPLKLEVNLQSSNSDLLTGTEYDNVYNAITNALPPEDAITGITLDGEDRESLYLSKLIGEDESNVIRMVKAFIYAGELNISSELVYALLRAITSTDKKVVFNQTEDALRNAITTAENNKTINILGPDLINTDINKILQWQIAEVTQIGITTEETTLEELFTTAFSNETYLSNLLAATRNFTGASVEAFWTEYQSEHGSVETQKVQKGLQFLAVTGLQPKMTKYLLDTNNFNGAGELTFNGNLKDLAKWTHSNWVQAINSAGGATALPKSVSPGGNADDIPVYAEKLKDVVDSLHPTASIQARIAANASLLDNTSMQATVTTFLNNNPNYDFRNQSVYEINATDYNLTGVADLDALKSELAPFQRLARITGGKPEAMSVLKAADLTSAHAIVNAMSLNQFVATYSTHLGGAAAATTYYNNASRISTIADQAAVSIAQYGHTTPFVLTGGDPVDPVAYPELATLFGSLEQCGCEYCMSLYSPSAYYVDVLNFVKKSSNSAASAFDELTRRRPDLLYIDLTCKNANTPLPYIDLVNELLELEILRKNNTLPGYPSNFPLSYQTEATAAELAAYPEHWAKIPGANPGEYEYEHATGYQLVYDHVLSAEKYPDILPFNLAWEEARVYLAHLGKTRYELMQLFKPLDQGIYKETSGSYPDYITQKNLLGEYLGISKQSAAHITQTSTSAANIAPYYGLKDTGTNNLLSPSDTSIILSDTWNNLLTGTTTDGGIDVLLSRLDISYKDLLQLLTTESLNKKQSGVRPVNITAKSTHPDDQATCILKELKLDIQSPHSAASFFSALHRFVRFWRASGLSIYELDTVLTSLGISSFNAIFLSEAEYKLASQAIVFARQFHVSIDEIATWWADIREVQYTNYNTEYQDALPSFYDTLFKSKLVKNPSDEAFDHSNLSSEKYEDHIPAILAAAGIKEDELRLLAGADMLNIPLANTMSLSGLTSIFREAMAARILGVSVNDLVRIYKLKNIDLTPAVALTAGARQELLEDLSAFVTTLSSSRFSLSEWEYLIKNDDANARLTPAHDEMERFHESLQAELYKLAAVIDTLESIDDLDPVEDLIRINEIKTQQANIKKQLQNALIQKYGTEFSINADIVQYLLNEVMTLTAVDTSEAPLLEIFISDGFYKADLSAPSVSFIADYTHGAPPATTQVFFDLDDMYDVYLRFAKIALLVNRLKLRKEEFKSLQENNASLDVINVLKLEGAVAVPQPATIDEFVSYVNWLKVRDLLNVTGEDFSNFIIQLLAASQPSDWIDELVAVSEWDEDSLEELVGTGGELYANSADYRQASLILRIGAILNACDVIGITPQEFKRMDGVTARSILWANLKMPDSEKIIKTARAKYTEAAWSKIAKPLRDELREKQRKALVAYLLAHPNPTNGTDNQRWRNENELYAYFLIDVEMSPCMKTSRTKQAISSVQLYMDRVMMNLEYENMTPWVTNSLISIEPEEIEEWKTWRKWYRIWEANRKIFLYPENWIEPELRDGKSPEFVEFETHLMQDDVTPRLVEEAYIDYLEKLDDFARLEPVINYHEYEPATLTDPGVDIIHAFARTHVQPHHYYYRKFEDNEWTPWEKINLDIKGDHFTAYVKNKRLYIFWLTFMEKDIAKDSNNQPTSFISGFPAQVSSSDQTWRGNMYRFAQMRRDEFKYWNVVLNWSEYKDNKWQKSKVSKDNLELIPEVITVSQQATDSINGIINSGGNAPYLQLLEFLNNKHELSPNQLFRDRIYISPYEWFGKPTISLQLTDGLDEYCVGLHAFQFTEDMSDVTVLRQDELEYCLKAPEQTLIKGNKFLESPLNNNKLEVSDIQKSPDAHYGYTFKNMQWSERIKNISTSAILNNTPLGLYKIAAKSNLTMSDFESLSPVLNHFFFEDDTNTYFVRRVFEPFSAEVVTGELNNYHPLLNPNRLNVLTPFSFAAGTFSATADLSGVSVFEGSINLPSYFNFNTPATAPIKAVAGTEYYKFETFYHPHANNFIRKINTEGIKGLLSITTQDKSDSMDFNGNYQPTTLVYPQYPTNIVDFDYGAAYSLYNWELFFHMPMTIAQRLSNNQQFEEAQKWYHYIFNPTSNVDDTGLNIIPGKERFWRFRPFYEYTTQQQTPTTSQLIANVNNYKDQIDAWEKNPFQPHVIARMRILAYMKNVVMKYIDNLIAWGDQLFRRDTIESINEATQLYILAANILGERPQEIPARAKADKYCFVELDAAGLDLFSNAKVQIEAFMGPNILSTNNAGSSTAPGSSSTPSMGNMGYFCLSNNDKLLAYWDTVADRLFKIRNCRNIDGVLRELPLYEPPIDPALLVKAAAAGVDINSVLDAQAGIGMPHYRFNYVLQKANELCADVRGLGSAVLSALEKKDAEALALLRSGHEITVMEKVKAVKEAQVKEAEEALNGLQKTREATEIRQRYYSSRPFMNSGETQHLQSLQTGMVLQATQGALQTTASALSLVPQFHLQATFAIGGSFGGQQLANALNATSSAIGIASTINSAKGNMAQVKAGYERRMDDWKFQAETAAKELEQIDKQIIGAEIRLDIARKELENHELQMENSREADEFMRSKFTNVELYNWMLGQLATVYFQSYQLAYDLAKKAETCYDFELPHAKDKKPTTGFIRFGYWDSLKKGLLAGEKLQFDLRKMDASYMEQNKRTLELTKHISLALTDPAALLALRQDGTCMFDTSEWMFDLDFPSHYYRRIKSVSVSIPAITGPYVTLGATLSMGSNTIYDNNYDPVASPQPAMRSIATSNGQNDAGMFELNFRDERHLPFEGAGVEATWSLDMMENVEFRQFDYNTISDVIIHIKYIAYDDSTGGKKDASIAKLEKHLEDTIAGNELPRYFSLKHEFSNDWYAYAKEANNASDLNNVLLQHEVNKEQYPFFCKGKDILLQTIVPVLRLKEAYSSATNLTIELYDNLASPPIHTITTSMAPGIVQKEMGTITLPSSTPLNATMLKWKVKVNNTVVNITEVFEDLYLVTNYKLSTN